MKTHIECTLASNGRKILFPIKEIAVVTTPKEVTCIFSILSTEDTYWTIEESYEEVKAMIETASTTVDLDSDLIASSMAKYLGYV